MEEDNLNLLRKKILELTDLYSKTEIGLRTGSDESTINRFLNGQSPRPFRRDCFAAFVINPKKFDLRKVKILLKGSEDFDEKIQEVLSGSYAQFCFLNDLETKEELQHEEIAREQDELELYSEAYLSDVNIIESVASKNGEKEIRAEDVYVKRKIEDRILRLLRDPESERMMLVQGEAGHGKTTLLWNIYHSLSADADKLVLFLKASRFVQCDLSQFKKLIDAGRNVLLLVDTVDTLLHVEEERDNLILLLNGLMSLNIRLILTSRVQEFKLLTSNNKLRPQVFYLGEYNDTELNLAIRAYAKSYSQTKGIDEVEYEHTVVEAVSNKRSLIDICKNPLTLRMLFSVYYPHDIPSEINVFSLYSDFWQHRVEADNRTGLKELIDYDDLSICAFLIAMEMLISGKPEIHWRRLNYLLLRNKIDRQDIDKLKSRGVINFTEYEEISFFHQTFFEHVAARAFEFYFRDTSLSLLRDKVIASDYDQKSSDLFLLPVFEQLLLLTEFTFQVKTLTVLKTLLGSDKFSEIDAGIYVYSQLQKELDNYDLHLIVKENLETWEYPHIIKYLKVSANSQVHRLPVLFKHLEIILDRGNSGEWERVLELVNRFSTETPMLAKGIYDKKNIIENFCAFPSINNYHEKIESRNYHKPGNYHIVETSGKLAIHSPEIGWPMMMKVINYAKDVNVVIKSLSFVWGIKELREKSDITNLFELELMSFFDTSKFEKEVDVRVIESFELFLIKSWKDKDLLISQILADIEICKNPFSFQSRLYALYKYSSISKEVAEEIFNYWVLIKEPKYKFRWSRFFIKHIIETSSFNKDHLHHLLKQDLKRTLINYKQMPHHFAAYCTAFRSSDLLEADLSDLFNFDEIKDSNYWLNGPESPNFSYLWITLFFTNHIGATNAFLSKTSNKDSLSDDLVKYLHANELSFSSRWLHIIYEILIYKKDIKGLHLYLSKHTGRKPIKKDIFTPVDFNHPFWKGFYKKYLPALKSMIIQEVHAESSNFRKYAISLWGILNDLNHSDLVTNKHVHEHILLEKHHDVLTEYLSHVAAGIIPEEGISKSTIQRLAHHNSTKVRTNAQAAYFWLIIECPDIPYDLEETLHLALADFRLDNNFMTIVRTSQFLDFLTVNRLPDAITFARNYFFSEKVINLPKTQSRNFKRVFNSSILKLFENCDREESLNILFEACHLNYDVGILFVDNFFSMDWSHEYVQRIEELMNSNIIDPQLKRVIENHRSKHIRLSGNTGWEELQPLLAEKL